MAGAPSSLQLPNVANSLTHLPQYDNTSSTYPRWESSDPRSSSTQSLVPSLAEQESRRTLLIIYVHGFMGNDTSFQSFPAHVHGFLKETLAESHVIHSKIYPRYKTYKAIDVARDIFSSWLVPHESPRTDVVLVGHSMGGLLAAEVALIPSGNTTSRYPFRHRILGTVSLDAPLLGLHPGIVVSGIASLFRPAAAPGQGDRGRESSPTPSGSLSPDPSIYSEVSPPSEASSPAFMPFPPPPNSQTPATDPFFNPPFFNDIPFVDRGWFKNIAHFAKKHKEENLVGAAATHIMSHLEFGGCLADYPGLKSRYNRLRRLEDDEDFKIRFVNYYTASTGPLKRPKTAEVGTRTTHLKPTNSRQAFDGYSSDIESRASTPRISIEDYSDGGRPAFLQELEPLPEPEEPEPPLQSIESLTLVGDNPTPTTTNSEVPGKAPDEQDFRFPSIPDLPSPFIPPDLDLYTNKEARKQAEKEAKRAKKIYDQAIKDREKAIKEREKLIEKQRRKSLKEAEKRAKVEDRKEAQAAKTRPSQSPPQDAELLRQLEDALLSSEKEEARQEQRAPLLSKQDSRSVGLVPEQKKKKERKFCMLPSKTNGVRDPTWVRVYMEGVDEVGAHCGLFFPGPHYEKLVGDVGSRIVEWVQEDASRRAVSEFR